MSGWTEGVAEEIRKHLKRPGHLRFVFNCSVCGLTNVVTYVELRKKNEDIARWIKKKVIRAAYVQHCIRSMNCNATSVDVILPTPDGATYIGELDED